MKRERWLEAVFFCIEYEWAKKGRILAKAMEKQDIRTVFCGEDDIFSAIWSVCKEKQGWIGKIAEPVDAARLLRHILVVTSSSTTAYRLMQEGILCVGCARLDDGYFVGAELVTDAPELLTAYELEMCLLHFHGLPVTVAVTERLILREIVKEDVCRLCEISRQQGMQYLQDSADGNFFDSDRLTSYIKYMYRLQGYGLWSVLKKDGTLIGCCGLAETSHGDEPCGETKKEILSDVLHDVRLELQYMLDEPYQRRGYGTEMCRAALQYAFEHTGWGEVWLCVHPANTASVRLAGKLGFFAGKTGKTGLLHFSLLKKNIT